MKEELARKEELLAESEDLLSRGLQAHVDFHDQNQDRFRFLKQKGTLGIYADLSAEQNGPPERTTVMVSGVLPGEIPTILEGLYADTSEDVQIVATMSSGRPTSGSVIHVFYGKESQENQTDEDIFFGIKHQIVKTPLGKLVSDREILAHERSGYVMHEGIRFGFICTKAMELEEHPPIVSPSTVSACYLFRPVGEHSIGVFVFSDFETPPLGISFLAKLVGSKYASAMVNALLSGYAKAYSALIKENSAEKQEDSKNCSVCGSHPLIRKLRPCAGCSSQVCYNCRYRRVLFALCPKSKKPKKAIFCRVCVGQVENQLPLPHSSLRQLDSAERECVGDEHEDKDSDASDPSTKSSTLHHSQTTSRADVEECESSEPPESEVEAEENLKAEAERKADQCMYEELKISGVQWNEEERQRLSDAWAERILKQEQSELERKAEREEEKNRREQVENEAKDIDISVLD